MLQPSIGQSLWNSFEIYEVLNMYYPVLLFQPRDLENDTKSVHSYDEASLAAGQTYQVWNVDPLEHIYAWFI